MLIVGTKVLSWDWTEGAASSGLIREATREGRTDMDKTKPFWLWRVHAHQPDLFAHWALGSTVGR